MKLLLAALLSANLFAGLIIKKTISKGSEKIISVKQTDKEILKPLVLKKIKEFIAEKDKTKDSTYIEMLVPNDSKYKRYLSTKKTNTFSDYEIKEIIKSGKDSNRIILTFLGDGYTMSQKSKFFGDVQTLVKDIFEGETFKSYLSLFNIYAIFTPSAQSGISDMTTKRTAFDLYRSPRGSKRGIMPGNKDAIEAALDLIDVNTDYPIIIANDSFYGGLGGRYAITTSSKTSGAMVLRHELGHNFSNVGEEYDGGEVYSGANFSTSKNVSWNPWVNTSNKVNESQFLTGSYVWQDLSAKDFKVEFDFQKDETHLYELKISSVGWKTKEDVKVLLDGQELEITGVFTDDRSFFTTKRVALSIGSHQLQIIDNKRDNNNILAYAKAYAYPKEYNFTEDAIGAFSVYDSSGNQKGYRPTHNTCLMREMRSKVFCSVDQENIWLQFLSRVSLIDSIEKVGDIYTVKTLDLKKLHIRWFKKKKEWGSSKEEIKELAGKWSVNLKEFGEGKYYPTVTFSHREIRKTSNHTTDESEIKVK